MTKSLPPVLAVVRQMRGAARHGRLEQGALDPADVIAAAQIVRRRWIVRDDGGVEFGPDEPITDDVAWRLMCEIAFS